LDLDTELANTVAQKYNHFANFDSCYTVAKICDTTDLTDMYEFDSPNLKVTFIKNK